jgi:hypothetical protein
VAAFFFANTVLRIFYFSTTSSCGTVLIMTQYSKPLRLRVQGGGLGVTIPNVFVRMGLLAGDTVLFRREPDGLRLRIIRHSALVELANAQGETAQGETVAAE